jgi:hypothetical protein
LRALCTLQLHWTAEDETFEGTVVEVDPRRAFHTHVHYLADDDDEWGYFQGGVFHTSDGDQRRVRGVTASAAAAAASKMPELQAEKSHPSGSQF